MLDEAAERGDPQHLGTEFGLHEDEVIDVKGGGADALNSALSANLPPLQPEPAPDARKRPSASKQAREQDKSAASLSPAKDVEQETASQASSAQDVNVAFDDMSEHFGFADVALQVAMEYAKSNNCSVDQAKAYYLAHVDSFNDACKAYGVEN